MRLILLVLMVIVASCGQVSKKGDSKSVTKTSVNSKNVIQKQPNFIILYADDLGWPGLSVLMDERVPDSKSDYYQTPNLERLANEGVVFSNGYAGSPVCSASRASLLTGMTTAKHGMTALVGWKGQKRDDSNLMGTPGKINDIQPYITLPEQLKKINSQYATAHFGKWHLKSGGPGANGFDENDGSTANREGDVGGDDPKKTFSISGKGIEFMKKSIRNNRPFYLQLSYYAVHLKMKALQKSHEKYKGLEKGSKHANPLYAAMTEDLDSGIGMVLNAVKELGISENTYIIFSSDNGPYVNSDVARNKGEISSALPLSKGKFWVYEGGIRVPFIVSGPNIDHGKISHTTVTQYDLYPTICDLAGGQWPEQLDGGSLRHTLHNDLQREVERPSDYLVWHYPHFNRQATPHTAVISENYKLLHFWEDESIKLFDLEKDPYEKINIANEKPELAQKLLSEMNKYITEVDAVVPKRK
ncbi:MAG: sulfatase [Carboxylicivirga sp.]|jgi:arylsulfatase A-like enzyme|nr:sulfatase [Carboxylicivirga sp.]